MAVNVKYSLAFLNIENLNALADQFKFNTSELNCLKFKVRYADIESIKSEFCDAHISIESGKVKDFDLNSHRDKYAQFFDMYYRIKEVYLELCQNSSQSEKKSHNQNVILPSISLPSFSGVYTEFHSFISLFNTLVHNNDNLNGIQKMHYLFSCLKGEAISVIKHLSINDNNYYIAYNLILERFDNVRLIADNHLSIILALRSVSNIQELRNFINTLKENYQALASLNINIVDWDFILVHIIIRKLNADLRIAFENQLSRNDMPKFSRLLEFLENQCRILDVTSVKFSKEKPTKKVFHSTFHTNNRCNFCKNESHAIFACNDFKILDIDSRRKFVKDNRLCFSCLKFHDIRNCKSSGRCKLCNSNKHNTLLHVHNMSGITKPTSSQADYEVSQTSSAEPGIHSGTMSHISSVLLATARISVKDSSGNFQIVRALLDSGSMSSFITEACVQRLRLNRKRVQIPVTCLGGTTSHINGSVTLTLKPRNDPDNLVTTTALILKHLTNNLPSARVPNEIVNKFKNLSLADEYFDVPAPIDILLGADLYSSLLDGSVVDFKKDIPRALGTIFGFVISGPYVNKSTNPPINNLAISSFLTETPLEKIVEKFWESENLPEVTMHNPEDEKCEEFFMKNLRRDMNGRFISRLPFKENHPELGDSYNSALRRFLNLEKRFLQNENLKLQYSNFMREYLLLGHMSLYTGSTQIGKHFYIPHHAVFKSTNNNKKIRVVFDASATTSTSVSLNDCLYAGPKLHQDIINVILNFRCHPIALICDIKMMFRQILIDPVDQPYQLIFWRESSSEPVQTYALSTVTYGVKSSPYASMRVLRELAKIGEQQFPQASEVLQSQIFVDDIITTAASLQDAMHLKHQLISILQLGGFELRKWSSNSTQLLEDIPLEHREMPHSFDIEDPSACIKVLGIQWDPVVDNFKYSVNVPKDLCTKRTILSTIARIFDPLGWISPITFKAKLIMQRLWLLHSSWDTIPPQEIVEEWKKFVADLKTIDTFTIPRQVFSHDLIDVSIHGFCDGSLDGYAGVVYVRTINMEGSVKVSLLAAKSKIAPVRTKLTVPKLELNSAVLLSRLINFCISSYGNKINFNNILCWSDSTICLAWLQTPPHRLQMYEGNRVSQILNSKVKINWRYVPSKLNCADVASRGAYPSEMLNMDLWWHPQWLEDSPENWPCQRAEVLSHQLPGLREIKVKVLHVDVEDPLSVKFSSLQRLQRTVALCFRFFNNCRNKSQRLIGPITVEELKLSLLRLIKLEQKIEFSEQIDRLKNGRLCSLKYLQKLLPFLDSNGLMRVGGRLRHSTLAYDSKFPILLPKSSHLTNLIVDNYHKIHCHVGPNALNAILQQKFWIISARRVIRSRIHKCMTCFKLNPKSVCPQMADLPSDRVRAGRVFERIATDYAGPFTIRASKIRNAKTMKSYLCLFICLATKAVHLEVVSDLSSEGFLAALSRFSSRRGLPTFIRSDCGTNYVGSNRHLNDVQKYFRDSGVQQILTNKVSQRNITWHFNAPSYPNCGGLFEAGIKSAKTLLKRVIGEQILTFEEFSTVSAEVEAVLNSRPLTPLSEDASEWDVLTPGHFLIGQPLVATPEVNVTDVPVSRLTRYQLLKSISQRFWLRWQREYLHTLQQRSKWLKATTPPNIGDLVLIREDNLPPLQWRLGRISRLITSQDGVTRIVELRTPNGILMRPVLKLCPLPCQED